MDKKAIMAIAVLVTVGITLAAASGVGAVTWGATTDDVAADDREKLADEIIELMEGAAFVNADVLAEDVPSKGDIIAVLMEMEEDGITTDCHRIVGCISPGTAILMGSICNCEHHTYIVCPPCKDKCRSEVHAGLLWGECSDANLDLRIRNDRGTAKSNADRTLTEEVTIPNSRCGWTYVTVRATKVDLDGYCNSLPYALAVDCERPLRCNPWI